MDDQRRVRVSKFLSRYLRHAPERLGLTLGPGGWVPIPDLLAGAASAHFPITREEVDEVVRRCDKQRFTVDETGTLIRANQGHTAAVDLDLEAADPPAELYHGTAGRSLPAILREGLRKMARHHVHLSPDVDTALRVGRRHGVPVVLAVDAAGMAAAGVTFFRSANGVWLVDRVPPEYLRVMDPGERDR